MQEQGIEYNKYTDRGVKTMNCLWIILLLFCCGGNSCSGNTRSGNGCSGNGNDYGRSNRGNERGRNSDDCGCDNEGNGFGRNFDGQGYSGVTRFPEVTRLNDGCCDND